ncbi:MAG: DUF115 domain-containing protein [Proteobacteria bacterium]|nr:DUF115 domain-containing protein [Pseudomonadota bacterium]MBU1710258.1 DUF115 domain-containing protein [Pseudomonadota bacterium]
MEDRLPDFFESNMALLHKHHPAQWETFSESPPDPVGEVYKTASGELNLRVTGRDGETVTMHSAENPKGAGDDFLTQVPEEATGLVGLLGMGLGHGALAIINERPHIRHLAIFELDPGIFRQAMQHIDLADLLSDPRVLLSVTPTPEVDKILTPAFRALMLENIHTLRHLPSFALHETGYKELNNQLFERFNRANVEGNTNIYHGKTYLTNRLENMKTIHHHCLIDRLHNRFKGIPAIIVAGGPSLDKNIDQLKEAQGKAVIIAVDSTLPALLAHGVTPNFVTTIDAQDLIFEKFAHVADKCRDVSIITMPWVSSKVARVFPAKKIFWTFTALPIESWLLDLLGGHLRTGGAATVAHLNLQAATILGCSPIIFVGQDLAYTDNKDHADNTTLTHKETMDLAIGSENGLIWSDGVNGGKVATNRSFFEMRLHFEKMISNAAGFEIINSTEGGVHIEGTQVLPLKESLARFCRHEQEIDSRIHPPESKDWHPDPRQLLAAYKKLLEKIISVQKTIKANSPISQQAIKLLKQEKRSKDNPLTPQTLPPDLQKKIIAVNDCHQSLDKELTLWQIIRDLTLAGIRDSERKKHALKKIQGEPEKYSQWLIGSMECYEEINDVRRKALALFKKHFSETLEFHRAENRLLKRIHKGVTDHVKDSMKLARHYYETGNIVLLEKVLETLPPAEQDSAEVHFYRGIIAAHLVQYDAADRHFGAAIQAAPVYAEKIRAFQEQMAEEYREYGRNFIIDVKSRRRMLIKGLRYCSDYQPLIDVVRLHASEGLKAAQDPSKAPAHLDCIDLVKTWCRDIEEHDVLRANLLPSQIAGFYQQLIVIQHSEDDTAGVLNSYSRILAITPDDASVHHNVASILFGLGEFQQGIKHLEKAVAIDKSYAGFWEKIGDNLYQSAQFDEAIFAYEKCFMAWPENTGLLKKIGDCYVAMNQPEAAKAAYLALKEKLMAGLPTPPQVH